MADVNFTPVPGSKGAGVNTIVWESLTSTNSAGTAYESNAGDRSIQVVGTFDSATVPIEGSNDGNTWATLHDLDGDPLSFTSAGLVQIAEFTKYVRPGTLGTPGENTDVDVYLTERGS